MVYFWVVVFMVSNKEIKEMLEAKRGDSSNRYLICDKCGGYYELQKRETPEDFTDRCECGGNLKFHHSDPDINRVSNYTDEKNKLEKIVQARLDERRQKKIGRNKSTTKKSSTETNIIPILAVFCMWIFIIVLISGIIIPSSSYDALSKSYQTGKPTIIILSASWCSACQKLEQDTLSDERVRQKINTNYNFQNVDVDQNHETAQKYSTDGISIVLPTIIILNASGNEIRRHEGYMTPDEFLNFI